MKANNRELQISNFKEIKASPALLKANNHEVQFSIFNISTFQVSDLGDQSSGSFAAVLERFLRKPGAGQYDRDGHAHTLRWPVRRKSVEGRLHLVEVVVPCLVHIKRAPGKNGDRLPRGANWEKETQGSLYTALTRSQDPNDNATLQGCH